MKFIACQENIDADYKKYEHDEEEEDRNIETD